MKKIFNLILAALVIIGAAACTKSDEIVDQTQQGEGLSFYANVVNDVTRAHIDDTDGDKTWNTVWEGGEVLVVETANPPYVSYEFTCTDTETGKFVCKDDNATELLGKSVTISNVDAEEYHSRSGNRAYYIWTNIESFSVDQPINLVSQTSFFRYTYNGEGEVTLSLSIQHNNGDVIEAKKAFREPGEGSYSLVEQITFKGKGETIVPFWPGTGSADISTTDATLSYSIKGVKCKETTIKNICWGKVYNLGTLTVPEWGIAGYHNNWTAAPMYQSNGCYVALGVPAGTEFKFKKNNIWKGVVKADASVSANTWTYFNNGDSNIKLPTENKAYDIYMNRANGVFCVVKSGEKVSDYVVPTGKAIYLNGGGSGFWDQGGAHFEAWAWLAGGDGAWYVMADVEDGIYRCIVPSNVNMVKFIRRSSASPRGSWEGSDRWNDTSDLKIPTDKNLYTITGWNATDGNWSTK